MCWDIASIALAEHSSDVCQYPPKIRVIQHVWYVDTCDTLIHIIYWHVWYDACDTLTLVIRSASTLLREGAALSAFSKLLFTEFNQFTAFMRDRRRRAGQRNEWETVYRYSFDKWKDCKLYLTKYIKIKHHIKRS